MSPAREELRRCIEQLVAARADLARAQEPAARLDRMLADLTNAESELAALRTEDERILGEWLAAGAAPPRPSVSDATLMAEQRVAQLSRDGGAARSALPELNAEVARCSEAVGAISHQHRSATWRASAEEAARYAEEAWLPAMCAAVAASAPLESLKAELHSLGRGADPDPAALSAMAEVDRIIQETRAAAVAPSDPTAGPRLLAALAHNPGAELA
jgi:hypothetical protein